MVFKGPALFICHSLRVCALPVLGSPREVRMPKTVMIRARIEPHLKEDVERVLAEIGLSPTEAIRLFYRHISSCRGLPFDVRIPNAATREAMAQARSRKNLRTLRGELLI